MKRSPVLAVAIGLGFAAMLLIANHTPAPDGPAPWWDNFFIGAIGSVVGGVWIWRQYKHHGHGGWMNILFGVAASVTVLLIILGVIR